MDSYWVTLNEQVHLNHNLYKVTVVAWRLSGGSSPGGTDSVILQHWLLRFGEASTNLRLVVASVEEFLANHRIPREAYHDLMDGRLIRHDDHPGLHPVGVD